MPFALCVFLLLAVEVAVSTSITTVIDPPIRDLFSLDRQHLWVLVHNKNHKEFLFRTTNGGDRWTAWPLPFSIWHVFFADQNEGWGIAAEGIGSSARIFARIRQIPVEPGNASGLSGNTMKRPQAHRVRYQNAWLGGRRKSEWGICLRAGNF